MIIGERQEAKQNGEGGSIQKSYIQRIEYEREVQTQEENPPLLKR